MPKISVIVPVYNTQDYLFECLNSIANQTLKDIEVILIDDGSKDNSSIICDDFVEKDSRFIVVHKNNEGVSAARNVGLDIAKGDFISFVDSDDTLLPKMLNTFIEIAEEKGVDIVQSKGAIINTYYQEPINIEVFDNKLAMDEFFKLGKVRPSLCIGIYKRELFEKLRFPNNIHQWEDYALKAILVSRSKKIAVTNERFYNYTYREGSATKQPMNDRQMSCLLINNFLETNKIYRSNKDRYSVVGFFWRCCFLHYVLHTPHQKSKYSKIIHKGIIEDFYSIILANSVNIKTKCVMFIYLLSEKFTRYICNLYYNR